ncbi:MAG: hypothetical protein INF88_12305 [Roseomonas sp.]|nr:hypothetical protein [Roseomonas sp.]
MSLIPLRREVLSFLNSDHPEVLCITGKWGVGKTYAWESIRKAAIESSSSISPSQYSYVSIFGQNSLDDIKASIIENLVDGGAASAKPDWASFNKFNPQFLIGFGEETLRKIANNPLIKELSALPQVSHYSAFTTRLLYLNLKPTLICFDDLERAGRSFDLKLLLGLASSLKIEKKCKVVLILNDDALNDANEKEFQEQLEKIADRHLRFEPTAADCSSIAIPNQDKVSVWVKENCEKLGMKNIRVIHKALNSGRRLSEILQDFEEIILRSAIRTAVLAVFAKFQPNYAPPIKFIQSFNYSLELMRDHQPKNSGDTGASPRFLDLLKNYEFLRAEEIDLAIIESIESGIFQVERIVSLAGNFQVNLLKAQHYEKLQNAWGLYHDTFAENPAELKQALTEALDVGLETLDFVSFGQSIGLLRFLGDEDASDRLLSRFISIRQHEIARRYGSDHFFMKEITDLAVKTALEKVYLDSLSSKKPQECLENLANDSWNDEDAKGANLLMTDDLLRIFKEKTGAQLKKSIKGAFSGKRVANPSTDLIELAEKAESALKKIAEESPLNQRRVDGLLGTVTQG